MGVRRTCLEIAEAAKLKRSHERSGEIYFIAPCHEDERPSFRINPGKDCFKCDPCNKGGNAWELMAFFAGCAPSDRKAVLAWRDAHGLGSANGNGTTAATEGRRIVETYGYRSASGELLFDTVRYFPKDFRQCRPDGKGGFIYNLQGVQLVPFQLPELLKADPTQPIFIVEGEKDAKAITERGGVATCNPMGAGKWKDEYSKYLTGRSVVIVPDNDDAGRKHAEQVGTSVHSYAANVKILELPGLPQKGDVSDWFAAGGTFEQLQKLAANAPLFAVNGQPRPSIIRLADVVPESVDWIWQSRLARGKMTLFIGDPGLGKSSTALDIASRISRGTSWPDGGRAPIGNVILLSAEDGLADTVRPRIDLYGGDPSRIYALQGIRQGDNTDAQVSLDRDLAHLERALDEIGDVVVLVIDPLSAYLGSKDSHKDSEIRGILGPLALLAERRRVCILGVMHLTKNSQVQAIYRAQGSIAFAAAARAVFCVGRDPDNEDRRILAHVKGNLSAPPASLAFEFIDGRIDWQSTPVNLSAQVVLSPPNAEDRSEQRDVRDFLSELLADGRMAAKEIFRAAHDNGFSDRTVNRVKKSLNIRAVKVGQPGAKGGAWYWSLPNDSQAQVSDALTQTPIEAPALCTVGGEERL